jgi:NADH:ubiquinone reductase (H+-translocating)
MRDDALPHVVIVGGGFGGLYAARALRSAEVRVTVIDRRNHHTFQPLLYQVANAVLSPADIAAPIRHVLRHDRRTEVLLAEVVDVDVDGRAVVLADGAESPTTSSSSPPAPRITTSATRSGRRPRPA